MSFDWIQFLSHHGIEYVTAGSSVTKGNIAIHCPFCGSEDQSHHMSISTEGRGWRCWRRPDHHGKSPLTLLQALLGCSFETARAMVGDTTFIPSDFLNQVQLKMSPEPVEPKLPELRMLQEYKTFKDLPSARMFINYLVRRGFTRNQIYRLSPDYGMRYSTIGPFKGRIIFPVTDYGRLATWTGRTVYPDHALRYRTLSHIRDKADRDGLPQAHGPISRYLLFHDILQETDADTIVLCEGPFDALKVNVLGLKHGIVATCFFTSAPSRAQIELLHELLPRFRNRYLALDQGTIATALRLTSDLSALGVAARYLPSGVKDPGELNEQQLIHMVNTKSRSLQLTC